MILVVDIGTTSLRAAIVGADGSVASVDQRPCPPDSPFPGLVEFDPVDMARLALDAANGVLDEAGNPHVAPVAPSDRGSGGRTSGPSASA